VSSGSLRLTFAYDEAGLRLAGSNRRTKPAPRSDDERGEGPANAVTAELRAADGRPLFRRVLREPIPQSVEVAGDDGVLRRVARPRSRGAFVVVVPDVAAATEVVIDAGPDVALEQPAFAEPATARRRRRQLGRFAMPGRA
jgi:hypothetical protein